jgi:hypothetical protein
LQALKGWILLFLPSFNGRCSTNIAVDYFVTGFGNSYHRLLCHSLVRPEHCSTGLPNVEVCDGAKDATGGNKSLIVAPQLST